MYWILNVAEGCVSGPCGSSVPHQVDSSRRCQTQ